MCTKEGVRGDAQKTRGAMYYFVGLGYRFWSESRGWLYCPSCAGLILGYVYSSFPSSCWMCIFCSSILPSFTFEETSAGYSPMFDNFALGPALRRLVMDMRDIQCIILFYYLVATETEMPDLLRPIKSPSAVAVKHLFNRINIRRWVRLTSGCISPLHRHEERYTKIRLRWLMG